MRGSFERVERVGLRKASERVFYEIKGKSGIMRYGGASFDIEEEFRRLRAMLGVIEAVYIEEDDYVASSWAYKYLMPRVLALLIYVRSCLEDRSGGMFKVRMDGEEERWWYAPNVRERKDRRERIKAWADESSERTEVRLKADNEKVRYGNYEYLYKEIKVRGMAIAARYYMHYNIQYLELSKGGKSYPRRMRVLRSAVWWSNQMLLNIFGKKMVDGGEYSDICPQLIVFSTMPSSGKSFVCNTMNEMFSALAMIIQKKGGCLRVGNEQGNILEQSRQTIGLLLNPLILDVYDELNDYVKVGGKFTPFAKSSEEDWALKGVCFTPASTIFKTRDSTINSVRCQLGMFDDPSRGQQESSNMTIHKRICNLFNGDFQDRFESQEQKKILLTGTMFNPEDVFSTEIAKALGNGFKTDERFRGTYISNDGKTVVIINDCEDEFGDSAYPEFISNEALAAKRASLPEYDYRCIWRQKPIPADGLIFSKEYLSFYDEMPAEGELSDYAFAVIDPTRRKASDFFSMPIFRRHTKTRKFYLVDIIYQRKSVLQLYDKITSKIFMHKIIKLGYEENTDTSLGTALKAKLKERDENSLNWVKMQQIYSTKNKLDRINAMADVIIQNIVFPSAAYKSPKSELGFAVHSLTNFDGDSKKNDDFPDSLAMFADMFIVNSDRTNYVIPHKNLPF